MRKHRFIRTSEIETAAEHMRGDLEMSPLSHSRKIELAAEIATELFGFTPRRSLILLIVKHADANWHATKIATLRTLSP